MSRFDDDLDRDIGVIAERVTPSPDAWEAIQLRIADREPETETEIIMLTENTLTRRRWPLVAAAAAVAALAIGAIALVNRDDGAEQPADVPTPTVPTVPTVDVNGAAPLPPAGSDVEPGRYTTDLLGMSLSFDVPETMALRIARPNRVVLASTSVTTDSPPPVASRTLSFGRISGWNTSEEAVDDTYLGPGSIDPDDIDGWAAANDLVASIPPCCRTVDTGDGTERAPTTRGGRTATLLDVRLEPAETNQTSYCDAGQSCRWAASTSGRGFTTRADNDPMLSTGQVNRFWVIHLDGEDPLLMHASAADGDEAWLELIDDTVLTDNSLPGPVAPPANPDPLADEEVAALSTQAFSRDRGATM